MTGLGFVEVDYHISFPNEKPERVHGVQVGRFAIRKASPDDHAVDRMPSLEDAPWRIDHIPSGVAVAAFDSFENAYALADDISRFSKSDTSSKDLARLKKQMGEQIVGWLKATQMPFLRGESPVMQYIPYREWLAEQGKDWKPPRRRMKSLFK